jgi:AcrR family transcriptional regulator
VPTTRQPKGKAKERLPLSRERAVEAAIALADAEGIEALSMRRLARELGVEAMSLYHHVANKDDILDGMVDAVFAEIDLPRDDTDSRTSMRERAVSQRAALLRHPWALNLMESRRSPGPETLKHHDAVIGAIRRAGFSLPMTAHAIALLDAYVYGYVLQELTLPFDDGDDLEPVVGEILGGMDAEQFPHLAEMAFDHVLQPGYRFADEFDFGLDLVLDGLAGAAGG